MKRFFILPIALISSSIFFASCSKCEVCVQYKVPMSGGNQTVVSEEEVCGDSDINAKEDEITNDVTFEGDSVSYRTYWECMESLNK